MNIIIALPSEKKGRMALEVLEPTAFVGPRWEYIKRDKNLLFAWINRTVVSNVIFWRSFTIRFGWPPIIYIECFTFVDD